MQTTPAPVLSSLSQLPSSAHRNARERLPRKCKRLIGGHRDRVGECERIRGTFSSAAATSTSASAAAAAAAVRAFNAIARTQQRVMLRSGGLGARSAAVYNAARAPDPCPGARAIRQMSLEG